MAIDKTNWIATPFQVFEGATARPVVLDKSGHFGAVRDEGGPDEDVVWRNTFQDLTDFFDGVTKRQEAKAKVKMTPFEGTMINGDTIIDVTIKGLGDDGKRVLASGLPKNQRLDGHTTIYKRLVGAELIKLQKLNSVIQQAQNERQELLKSLEVGRARDIGRKVQEGHSKFEKAT